ncbi:MAG: response regulator [Candidatus Omnitrophica bacterium]|nr:response regulator [Candidatus Omnitrophota bacterium]
MPRLLLADDDEKMLEVMSQYLSWHGFEVTTLNQCDDIMSLLEKNEYDLVAYNIIMERSGFNLCRSIRESADPKLSGISIMIFAPEPLELNDYIALRQLRLYFINKYENIEGWIKKINLILRLQEKRKSR